MEKLSQEIVEDIFLRLPLDSLGRCRYVSKHWLGLIYNPSFVKLHLKHSKAKNNCKLVRGSYTGLYFSIHDIESAVNKKVKDQVVNILDVQDHILKLEYPFNIEDKKITYFGSCDGLVLVFTSDHDMFLWNPTTRDFKILPGGNIRRSGYFGVGGYFPLRGFGYDELTDDYKVVSHGIKINSRVSEVSIYTLRKDSWSVVKTNSLGVDYGNECPGIFVNGILHWKVEKHHTRSTKSSIIISFDLKDEQFREVSHPILKVSLTSWDLGVLGGSLCVHQYYNCSMHGYVDVWVMRDYGKAESWTKLFCFKHPFRLNLSHMKVFQVLKNGDFLLTINCKDLVIYDAKHQRRKFVSGTCSRVGVEAYVQSLISLGTKNGFQRKALKCNRQRT